MSEDLQPIHDKDEYADAFEDLTKESQLEVIKIFLDQATQLGLTIPQSTGNLTDYAWDLRCLVHEAKKQLLRETKMLTQTDVPGLLDELREDGELNLGTEEAFRMACTFLDRDQLVDTLVVYWKCDRQH